MPAYELKVVLKSRVPLVSEMRNIFYFQWTVGDTGVTDSLDAYFNRLLTSGFLGLITSQWTTYSYDVYQWDGNEWQPQATQPYTKVGTGSGEYFPLQVAAVVLGKTGIKRTFSRKFWSGFTEAQGNAGQLVAGAISTLVTFGANWISSITVGTSVLQPVLWTKNHTTANYTGAVVDGLTGTQRRRKPNVGI